MFFHSSSPHDLDFGAVRMLLTVSRVPVPVSPTANKTTIAGVLHFGNPIGWDDSRPVWSASRSLRDDARSVLAKRKHYCLHL
jgi:hypothetical protein